MNLHALMYMPRLVTLNPPIYIFLSELNTREAINNQVLLTHQYNVTCRDFRNIGKVVSERETFALAYGSSTSLVSKPCSVSAYVSTPPPLTGQRLRCCIVGNGIRPHHGTLAGGSNRVSIINNFRCEGFAGSVPRIRRHSRKTSTPGS